MQKQTRGEWLNEVNRYNESLREDIPLLVFKNRLELKSPMIHAHDQLELGYCISGSGIFFVENKIYPFKMGDISVIFPGERHIAQSASFESSEWYFVNIDMARMFSEELCRTLALYENVLADKSVHGGVFRSGDNTECEEIIKALVDEAIRKNKEYEYMCRLLVSKLVLLISRSPLKEDGHGNTELSGEPIMPAILYILSHYSENIKISELSEMCHLSEGHMRRLFVSVLGYSPLEYLHRCRINYACAMLRSGGKSTVSEIADEVGYTTLSSFYRKFRQYVGCMPKEYQSL